MNPFKLIGGLIKFVFSVIAFGFTVMLLFIIMGIVLFIAALF